MQSVELRELTANEELGLEQEYATQCGHPSPVDETCGPTLYGGEQEGRRRASAVRSYTHRRHPYHASLLFPFSLFATCRAYIHFPCHLQEPTHSGAEHTNEDIRAPLTIGDVNISKIRGRTPSSKADGSLVLIDKDVAVSPSPEPLAIVLAGMGHRSLSPIERMEIKVPQR